MKVISMGEVLWDIMGQGEFLGGAPLNVCANLQRLGDEALLFSSVGRDLRGEMTRQAMRLLHLSTRYLQQSSRYATGTAAVSRTADGEPAFVIARPVAFDDLSIFPEMKDRLLQEAPDWLYFGTLAHTLPATEHLLAALRQLFPAARCFYDMNLRDGHWTPALITRLCKGVTILKLNETEAEVLSQLLGSSEAAFDLETFCKEWAAQFAIEVICVTLGPKGCCVYAEGTARWFSGYSMQVSDTVGAGDAFASAFLHGYQQGWPLEGCASFANALGAVVAGKAGATPAWEMAEVARVQTYNQA